jgi:hypothetical protein
MRRARNLDVRHHVHKKSSTDLQFDANGFSPPFDTHLKEPLNPASAKRRKCRSVNIFYIWWFAKISGEVALNESPKYQMMTTVVGTRVASFKLWPISGSRNEYPVHAKQKAGWTSRSERIHCMWMNEYGVYLNRSMRHDLQWAIVLPPLISPNNPTHPLSCRNSHWLQDVVSQRQATASLCEADPSFSRHLSRVGLVVSPYFRRCSSSLAD